MSSLDSVLEKTLEKIGGIEPATLGKTGMLSVSKENKKQLLLQLEQQAKFNNWMIIFIVILHFLLFGLCCFLVFYYRDEPNVIVFLLGGSVLGLMVIVYSFIRLLNIKFANDYMRVTLPNLPPEEAMVVVQSIYFEAQRSKWF